MNLCVRVFHMQFWVATSAASSYTIQSKIEPNLVHWTHIEKIYNLFDLNLLCLWRITAEHMNNVQFVYFFSVNGYYQKRKVKLHLTW